MIRSEPQKARNCMGHKASAIGQKKRIALVAHDNKKHDLLEWARFNRDLLVQRELYSTGTTGRMLEQGLEGIEITRLQKRRQERLAMTSRGPGKHAIGG